VYTPLTAGCAHIVQRWGGALDRERFAACGSLYRSFVDTHFRAMAFADERANPRGLGSYGIAIHALTPEGRGFLRMALDPEEGTVNPGATSLESLSRLSFELDYTDLGGGALPEPFHEGTSRITVPLGVARARGWTMGLSAMVALNREIAPESDYALDRQNLLYLSHADAGAVLPGTKSKRDPLWSTVRMGEDAYPARTGALRMEGGRALAQVQYNGFSVEVVWVYGDEPRLEMATDAEGPLTTQLVLEVPPGAALDLDGSRRAELGDDAVSCRGVCSVATDRWEITADCPGTLLWPVEPFSPYSAGNKSAPGSRRPLFVVDWTGQTGFTFRARSRDASCE